MPFFALRHEIDPLQKITLLNDVDGVEYGIKLRYNSKNCGKTVKREILCRFFHDFGRLLPKTPSEIDAYFEHSYTVLVAGIGFW